MRLIKQLITVNCWFFLGSLKQYSSDIFLLIYDVNVSKTKCFLHKLNYIFVNCVTLMMQNFPVRVLQLLSSGFHYVRYLVSGISCPFPVAVILLLDDLKKINTGGVSFCRVGIQNAMLYPQKYTPSHCFSAILPDEFWAGTWKG